MNTVGRPSTVAKLLAAIWMALWSGLTTIAEPELRTRTSVVMPFGVDAATNAL